ncbi:MAG: hypothetical protein AAF757_24200 [Cyanobacteria bacterium P01_D01_bin.116]
MANKLLNFRCPPELLEAINRIGMQRYPTGSDNGYDRSKTLIDILSAGVEALDDGSIDVPISKTERKTDSKTDVDSEELKASLKSELLPEIDVMLSKLRDEFEERLGKLKV